MMEINFLTFTDIIELHDEALAVAQSHYSLQEITQFLEKYAQAKY